MRYINLRLTYLLTYLLTYIMKSLVVAAIVTRTYAVKCKSLKLKVMSLSM